MKLLLFLGAGVSVPSGLPTAAQLTDAVLSAAYYHPDKGVFGRDANPTRPCGALDVTRHAITYEDLYFLCQQLSLWNIGLSDNPSLPRR